MGRLCGRHVSQEEGIPLCMACLDLRGPVCCFLYSQQCLKAQLCRMEAFLLRKTGLHGLDWLLPGLHSGSCGCGITVYGTLLVKTIRVPQASQSRCYLPPEPLFSGIWTYVPSVGWLPGALVHLHLSLPATSPNLLSISNTIYVG